jgi:hypothetical protein
MLVAVAMAAAGIWPPYFLGRCIDGDLCISLSISMLCAGRDGARPSRRGGICHRGAFHEEWPKPSWGFCD